MNASLRTLLLLAMVVIVQAASAQFPIRLGSAGQEYGKCAATERGGNIVIGMLFQTTIDFDPGAGSVVLGTPPGIDCAIVKYTPAGALVWARHLSGITGVSQNTVVTPHGLAVDASNNLIAVGYFGLRLLRIQANINYPVKTGQRLDELWGGFQFAQAALQGGLHRVH